MPGPEMLARALAAIVLCVGHFAVSHWLAARLVPRPAFLLRWLAMFLVGMFLASAGFHLLAALGLFDLPAALAAMALLVVVVFGRAAARETWRADLALERRTLRALRRLIRLSPRRFWIGAFVALVSFIVLRPLVLPPLGWDAVVAHAMKAGLWVHSDAVQLLDGPATWALYRNVPAGGSVFTAWGMLPFHDDFLAVAPEAAQWIGLCLAALAIARGIGVREPFASVAAGLVAALPPVRLLVGTGYVEPALFLCFGGAMAFGLRWLARGEAGALVMAATGLGLTAALSVRLMPMAVVVMLLLLVVRRPRAGIAAMAAFLVAAAPWYVYNLIDAGTPLPSGVLRLANPSPAAVWRMLSEAFSLVGNPIMYAASGAAPAIVAVTTVPWLIARRPRVGLALLAAGAAAVCSVFFLRDAQGPGPTYPTRLWVPVLMLAVPASMWWVRRSQPRLAHLYLTLLLFSLFFDLARFLHVHVRPVETAAMLRWAVGAFAIGVLVAALRRFRWRGMVAVAGASWLVAYAHGYHLDNRYTTFLDGTVMPGTPRGWAKTARLVDVGEPRRIAVVGDDGPWFTYGLLGTRLQNEVLHVPARDRTAWMAELRRLRVELVVAVRQNSTEETWMKAAPKIFRPLSSADQPIYKLMP